MDPQINGYRSLPDDPRINTHNQDDNHDEESAQEKQEAYEADLGEARYQENLD